MKRLHATTSAEGSNKGFDATEFSILIGQTEVLINRLFLLEQPTKMVGWFVSKFNLKKKKKAKESSLSLPLQVVLCIFPVTCPP